jgi:hypothetical protein
MENMTQHSGHHWFSSPLWTDGIPEVAKRAMCVPMIFVMLGRMVAHPEDYEPEED